jgi:hypothetical protein
VAKTRGGLKKNWKDNRKGKNAKYQQHLREVARQGKGFNAGGNEDSGTNVSGAMHDHLIRGYNFKG